MSLGDALAMTEVNEHLVIRIVKDVLFLLILNFFCRKFSGTNRSVLLYASLHFLFQDGNDIKT